MNGELKLRCLDSCNRGTFELYTIIINRPRVIKFYANHCSRGCFAHLRIIGGCALIRGVVLVFRSEKIDFFEIFFSKETTIHFVEII